MALGGWCVGRESIGRSATTGRRRMFRLLQKDARRRGARTFCRIAATMLTALLAVPAALAAEPGSSPAGYESSRASSVAHPADASQRQVTTETVLRALEGRLDDALPGTGAASLFAPPEPRRLRPCCAFGGVMKVKLLGVPVPWYRHKPLRGPADIGPHEYDPGVLQILPSPIHDEVRRRVFESAGDDEFPKRENNGEIYTCRGGFLDTAHVRDFADLAWFLAARVDERLETGGTIELVDYGGERRVTIHPVPRDELARAGRTRLAIAVAGRLSFDLSVWREAATWYGYQSVPPWPEKLSSFSPEDLYSNLLGTKLAEGILLTTPIRSRRDWDLAMTAWLDAAMAALGVVPLETAREMMKSVDDVLWSSSRWIPDWRITKRRKFDRGPEVAPWVVHTGASAHGTRAACESDETPVKLPVENEVNGISIDRIAEIEVVVSGRLVRKGLPLSPPEDRHIVESDYQRLIEAVRRETEEGLGSDDQPHVEARAR